ncbi:hypothetical protein BYT27DRAFT_7188859 [Phlegmacium glaucopus]|nr:hypothetical protein BYT27DRAFT_7188859 [Phlegmacium glaucopus]
MFFPKFYCIVLCMIALVSCTPSINVQAQRGVIAARGGPVHFLGPGDQELEPDRDNLNNDHDK